MDVADDDNVLASRTLCWHGKRVELIIGVPRPDPPGAWACRVQVNVAPGGVAHRGTACGVDAWQCLELANVELQHFVAERFPDAYAFEPGDEGQFSFVAPIGLPDEYAGRLRRHLSAERERVAQLLWDEALERKRARKRDGASTDGGQPRP